MTEININKVLKILIICIFVVVVRVNSGGMVYATTCAELRANGACSSACSCCDCCGSCSPGWDVFDCHEDENGNISGGCRCVCGGGGDSCDDVNWNPTCSVSCGWGIQYTWCGPPDGRSRACYAGPCCTNVSPSTATPLLPINGAILVNPSVNLTWQAPASWGNNCSGNVIYYYIYFQSSDTPITPTTIISCNGSTAVPSTTTSCTYTIPASTPPIANTGTTYYWRVATYNNGLITYSPTWSLKYVYPGVGVVGGGGAASGLNSAIWDATALGVSCAQNDTYKATKELIINSGDVTYSSALANSASISVDGIRGVLPTYTIKNVAYGAGSVCIDTSHNLIPAGLSYVLSCANLQADVDGNGTTDGAGSSSVAIDDDKCALLTSRDVGIKLDLGFKLIPLHWFNSVNGGDIFAGNTDQKVPATEDTTGGFKSYLITGEGFAFGKGSLKVVDAGSNTARVSENGGYGENIGSSFIAQSSFAPPSNATSISDCSGGLTSLDPAKVYQITSACLQTYVNGNTTYSLSKDGVAVVYVTGDVTANVTFGSGNKEFKSSNANRRILFISTPNFVVSSDLGLVSPTSNSSPNIEAGLVSIGNISFPARSGGSFSNPDTTVVLEGPLVAKGVVQSTRNRFLLNTYPTVVVKFNSNYLKYLRSQEKVSTVQNYTGKTSHDVYWVYQIED